MKHIVCVLSLMNSLVVIRYGYKTSANIMILMRKTAEILHFYVPGKVYAVYLPAAGMSAPLSKLIG
jgi:hypothetical protein